mgnify:CR=1 FL=1
MSMVFQEPMTALDPAFTIGDQIIEVIRAHSDVRSDAARALSGQGPRRSRVQAAPADRQLHKDDERVT